MTKRRILRWASMLVVAAVALVLGACNVSIWFAPETQGLGGYVYDARTANGVINGATVTITDGTGSQVYTASTDSSGHWFWSKPSSGTYTATVSGTGYFFTDPVTVKYDDSTTGEVDTAPVAGVDTTKIPTYGFTFILMWNAAPKEIDLAMTLPTNNISWSLAPYTSPSNYASSTGFYMDSPVYETKNGNEATIWNQGFGPNGSYSYNSGTSTYSFLNPGRTVVQSGAPLSYTTTNGTTSVSVERTGTGGYGPTTLTVANIATDYYPNTYNMALNGNGTNGTLASSYPLNKMDSSLAPTVLQGVAAIYVNAAGSDTISTANSGSTAATTASPVLYVVGPSTSGGPSALLGKYTFASFTNMKTVRVAEINIADTELQIVPDTVLMTDGTFKSAIDTPAGPVINVPRG